jgi:4-alpha-glucanotransferase
MSSASEIRSLNRLARLYSIQTAYYDMGTCCQRASPESLMAILRALGAPLAKTGDIGPALRERRQEIWRRQAEPVNVAWDGTLPSIKLRLTRQTAGKRFDYRLEMETGEEISRSCDPASLPDVETAEIEGEQYLIKDLALDRELPPGYHRLFLDLPGRTVKSLIISAPVTAYNPPENNNSRQWGVFLPLYALHSQRSWGSGDFADFEELLQWTSDMGGQVVGTLPLMAMFYGENSPYLPVSRLMWNEFYLDMDGIPEMEECNSAKSILLSFQFQNERKALRDLELVDYRQQMALKRRVLEELSRSLFAGKSGRLEDLEGFAARNPVIEDYAQFRAACEKQGKGWQQWPLPLREGTLKEGDYAEDSRRYHLYVQWLARQQMEKVSRKAKETGVWLYLDLPLGVHPDGYDIWRERDSFIAGTSSGAPPDPVFTRGQDWGFPPPHPEKIRENGYRHTIAYLQHNLRYADILRVDHVMGLHRRFCIPVGMPAGEGVYLHYHPEELYAIFCLESHRLKTVIVGEDLGTVPPYVRPAMNKHGFHRMYVLHYEIATNGGKGPSPVPRNSVASLNTHDMHPFSALWQGLDISHRRELGIIDSKIEREEKKVRARTMKILVEFLRKNGWLNGNGRDIEAAFKACVSFLAGSRARTVLVNLEDLWGETNPQNVPSTTTEYPDWQHKARYSFEEFGKMPEVTDRLYDINEIRQRRNNRR